MDCTMQRIKALHPVIKTVCKSEQAIIKVVPDHCSLILAEVFAIFRYPEIIKIIPSIIKAKLIH